MNADKIVEKAIRNVITAIGSELSEAQLDEVRGILSTMAIDVVKDTAQCCREQVATKYGPQTGIAADFADEIRRSQVALIANLQSMR